MFQAAVAAGLRLACVGHGTNFVGFEDTAYVEVLSDTVRIKPPLRTRAPINGNDRFGWWTLRGVKRSEGLIEGRIKYNLLNHPFVRLNLAENTLRIRGTAGSFLGKCKPYIAPEKPLTPFDTPE